MEPNNPQNQPVNMPPQPTAPDLVTPDPITPELDPVQNNPVQKKKIGFIKPLMIFVLLVLFVGGVGSGWYYYWNKKLPPLIPPQSPDKINYESRQWINCDDVREVVEENNTLYAACLGGVLVVDAGTGEVKDQIGMPQGLGNATATSLVKKGDILYIGTQDGFTKFDLKSREAKKISVSEGLVNGSNIELAEDGDIIWVGTFDGVSRYDAKTGDIKNYTKELAPGATKFSSRGLVVTPKAVYVHVIANAYAQGSIARYDKTTDTWTSVGPEAFGVTGDHPRIDLMSLISDGKKVYTDDSRKVWVREDTTEGTWQEIPGLFDKVKANYTDYATTKLVSVLSKGLIISANAEDFYVYNETSGELTKLPIKDIRGDHRVTRDNKTMYTNVWSTDDNNPWITRTNLETNQQTSFSLKRPVSLSRTLALIDEKPIVISNSGKIYIYDYDKDEFIALTEGGEADFGLTQFYPIPKSENIFIYSQSCGQGCSEPKIKLINYLTREVKDISYPNEIKESIKIGDKEVPMFSLMSLITPGTDMFTFYIGQAEKKYYAKLDIKTQTWSIEEATTPPTTDPQMPKIANCNKTYSFEKEKIFEDKECSDILENDKYTWQAEFDKITQVDKNTGERTILNVPMSEAPYSPFPDWITKQGFSQVVFAKEKLWIGSNLGLVAYDPNTKTYELFDTSKGLLTNEVTSFVVGDALWATTNWGGLSLIP